MGTGSALGRAWGCHEPPFKVQVEPIPARLFLREVQPAFSSSTVYPSASVLVLGLQAPHFLLDLNFAILHVSTQWRHPNVTMSLCCLVLDQRASVAFSASLAYLAQSPMPTSCSGSNRCLLTKEAPVYTKGGLQQVHTVETVSCSMTC